ncbi:MAG: hypothetical protein AAF830_06160 [Pseudomonadota bacterium]
MSDKPAPEEMSELDKRSHEVDEILKKLDAMRDQRQAELSSHNISSAKMAERARMSGLTDVMAKMARGTDDGLIVEPEEAPKKHKTRLRL